MSKQERKVIRSLTLQNLVETFLFIQENIDETEKDKISKMAALIAAATTELEKESAVQNTRVLLQAIRDTTSFGSRFGFGPHNMALNYLGDCIEQKTDIDFSRLYAMFDKPKVGSTPLFWMNPETRYVVKATDSASLGSSAEKDPGFNFS